MTPQHHALPSDVIDALVGIEAGDGLDSIRSNRPEARSQAQSSFEALFAPRGDPAAMSLSERFAVAAFIAALHNVPSAVDFYGELLTTSDLRGCSAFDVILSEAAHAKGYGPYGAFRGDLAVETVIGPEYAVDDLAGVYVLGERLSAGIEFAHFLVFHPRDASRARLQALLDAGWDADGIVTLAQLIAFLSFQIRVVAGLTALRIDMEGQK